MCSKLTYCYCRAFDSELCKFERIFYVNSSHALESR